MIAMLRRAFFYVQRHQWNAGTDRTPCRRAAWLGLMSRDVGTHEFNAGSHMKYTTNGFIINQRQSMNE
jgi:hypothetical protein